VTLDTPTVIAIGALIVAVLGLVPLYLDYFSRRKEREPVVFLEAFHEQITIPVNSVWTVRVRANRTIERCTVFYSGTPLPTLLNQSDFRMQMPIPRGGALNFRIPVECGIADEAMVRIQDGERVIRTERWGAIPHVQP
jgi:hypothetical protein